jgi:hypothetical protein
MLALAAKIPHLPALTADRIFTAPTNPTSRSGPAAEASSCRAAPWRRIMGAPRILERKALIFRTRMTELTKGYPMSIKIKAAEMKLAGAKAGRRRSRRAQRGAQCDRAGHWKPIKKKSLPPTKKTSRLPIEKGVSPQIKKRLKFDESKLHACLAGIRQLAAMPDPVGKVLLEEGSLTKG